VCGGSGRKKLSHQSSRHKSPLPFRDRACATRNARAYPPIACVVIAEQPVAGRAFELQDGAWPPAQFKARLRPLHAACADSYSMDSAKAITDWHIRGLRRKQGRRRPTKPSTRRASTAFRTTSSRAGITRLALFSLLPLTQTVFATASPPNSCTEACLWSRRA